MCIACTCRASQNSQSKPHAHVWMQVIEGKNFSPNHDLLHSFYTIDGYVQVTVNSEAGATSLATRSERGHVSPVWNQMLAFSDVALGNTFTVSLFDHKKLSSDVLLGQVGYLSSNCH